MPHFSDFDPDTYLELIRADVPDYDELQERAVAASACDGIETILELGSGSGETTRRLHAAQPTRAASFEPTVAGTTRDLAVISARRC